MLRRRPLLRAAATTAVVAGTATAVSGRVARRQNARWQQSAEAEAYEQQLAAQQAAMQQPAPPPPPAPAAGVSMDAIEELKQLAALKEQGVLTDEEFAIQKARLLA